jgi:hypothetical protein
MSVQVVFVVDRVLVSIYWTVVGKLRTEILKHFTLEPKSILAVFHLKSENFHIKLLERPTFNRYFSTFGLFYFKSMSSNDNEINPCHRKTSLICSCSDECG